MDKKEEIILATLDLACERGLSGVSLGQIAKKVGMKKPSIYNHFESKEKLIEQMYVYLREKAKRQTAETNFDVSALMQGRSAFEILMIAVGGYAKMNSDETMEKFYRLIYAQRTSDPAAAKIIADETKRMIAATKALFYAMQAHKKINCDDIDTAAFGFTMTVHSILDYTLDCKSCGEPLNEDLLAKYVSWFCKQFAAEN